MRWCLDITHLKYVGTVTDWDHKEHHDIQYDPEDPRSWRNTCGEASTLTDLLTDWRNNFESLNWVAFDSKYSGPYVWFDDGRKDDDWRKHPEAKETNASPRSLTLALRMANYDDFPGNADYHSCTWLA
jgi:hypothetical protein